LIFLKWVFAGRAFKGNVVGLIFDDALIDNIKFRKRETNSELLIGLFMKISMGKNMRAIF